jgi:hypothetical protein
MDRDILSASLQERRRCNAATPLGQLPPELVIHILTHAVTSVHSNEYQVTRFDARWSRAMLICASIRVIALSTPDLWASIDCCWSLPWIELCLERAGNKPLTLSADATAHIRVLGGLFHRCRELAIQADNSEIRASSQQRLFAMLDADGHSSALESFHFCGTSSSPIHTTPLFLGGTCDNLRSLVLHGVEVQETPLFPVLRHLDLKWVHTDQVCLSLLCMLEKAPLLKTLSIAHIYVRDTRCFHPLDSDKVEQSHLDLHLLATLHHVNGSTAGSSILHRLLQALPAFSNKLKIIAQGNHDDLSGLDAAFKQQMEEVKVRIA